MNICKVKNCTSKVHAKGMCNKHYRRFLKHGDVNLEREREYGTNNSKHFMYSGWLMMKDRCNNPNNNRYKYYGERGIKVCKRWSDSFQAFLADVGERPKGMTLDRINPDGNYEPSNCRWATHSDQARNKRLIRTNTTGYSGISFDKKSNKYRVRRQNYVTGEREYLGMVETLEEAKKLYDTPRSKLVINNKGENNPMAKLKDWQWLEIFKEVEKGELSQSKIAKKWGVSPASVSKRYKRHLSLKGQKCDK
jgi:hypothetical protein